MNIKFPGRGKKLAEFINSREWTKADFARRMGISPGNVNFYLEGQLDPLNLAGPLLREGCDLNWLCSEDAVPAVKEEKALYTAEQEAEIEQLAGKILDSMRLWLNHPPDAAVKREMRRIARKAAEEEFAKRK